MNTNFNTTPNNEIETAPVYFIPYQKEIALTPTDACAIAAYDLNTSRRGCMSYIKNASAPIATTDQNGNLRVTVITDHGTIRTRTIKVIKGGSASRKAPFILGNSLVNVSK